MRKILPLAFLFLCFSLRTMAIWTQTNGPAGGNVNCLHVNGSSIFAGTPNGVFLSVNSGASWVSKNTGLNGGFNHTEVYSITSIGSTIFIGTNEGVYSSINNGNTWVDANGGIGNSLPSFPEVYSMAVKGTDLFAGLYLGGIYRSSNNGATWTAVNTGFPINRAVNSIVVMGSNLFAGTYLGGILISTNNGNTWAAVPDASVATSVIRTMLVVGTTLFAAEAGTTGVLKSTNNGTTFSVVSTGFSFGANVKSFAVSGSDIYAGTIAHGIFKSSNNGSSWTGSTTGLISSQICGIAAMAISGVDIFAASEGCGIYKSSNSGSSWSESNTNFYNTTINAMAISGTNLFAGIDGVGIFKSTDDGNTWTNSTIGLPIYNVQAFKVIGPVIYAGYDFGVYKTLNNGVSWTPADNGLQGTPVYAFANDATYLYAASGDGIYITNNGGSSWTQSSSGLPSFSKIYDIAISGSSIYVGTDDGVYKSTNSAGSWTQVYSSFIPVTDLNINGTNIFAALEYGGMLLSSNSGSTWTPINTGFPSVVLVYSLTSLGSTIFAGTYDGVYSTSNAGTSWASYGTGFPPGTFINSMATNSNTIFAGTDYGVWKNSLQLSTQICIVTVDSASDYNVIIWEKPLVTTIDSFRIYREDVSNVYLHIASVGYNQLSQYIDVSTAGDPNLASRRYKIREVYTGGVLGSFSAYHNTILLQENGGNFSWNIYQVEGQAPGFPVVQNKLFRDNNSTGVWTLITTTAGTQTGFTDPDYGLYPNSRYRIEGDLGGLTCTPTMRTSAGVVTSKSNIKNKAIGINEINSFESKIKLLPNPAQDNLQISSSIAIDYVVIYDYLGREIVRKRLEIANSGSSFFDISNLPPGIYTVVCKGKDFEVRKKLVVE